MEVIGLQRYTVDTGIPFKNCPDFPKPSFKIIVRNTGIYPNIEIRGLDSDENGTKKNTVGVYRWKPCGRVINPPLNTLSYTGTYSVIYLM